MNEDLQLKIEAYISNSMSKIDVELFEKEMFHNDELKKEVALAKELNHFLKNKYVELEYSNTNEIGEIKSFLKSNEANEIEKTLLKVKNEYHSTTIKYEKRFNYFAVASVVILICMFSYFMFSANSTEDLFLKHYNLNDLPSLAKRSDANNDLTKGMNAFKIKEYKKALYFFGKINEKYILKNPSLFLYVGVANLELNKNEKAINTFDKLINSNLLDASKGYWFKALVYLKSKNVVKAKETLLIIASNKSNYKYKEAKSILEKLE